MKLRPLFDKIVIKQVEATGNHEQRHSSAFRGKGKPQMAEVIAVGPGGVIDGKTVEMQIGVGDKILYSKYAGSDFKIDGETVTIIRQSDVLAVVEG